MSGTEVKKDPRENKKKKNDSFVRLPWFGIES